MQMQTLIIFQEQQEMIKKQKERIEWLEKELNSIKDLLQHK